MTHEGEEETHKQAAGAEDLDDGGSVLVTSPSDRVHITSVRVAQPVEGTPIGSRSDDSVN